MKTNKESREVLRDLVTPLIKEVYELTGRQASSRELNIPLSYIVLLKRFSVDLGMFKSMKACNSWIEKECA